MSRGQKVLLIVDDDAAGSATLAQALGAAGLTVTSSTKVSWQYDGISPAPAGFDVILLLAGTANAANNDMPAAGQSAIANFVGGGGGLIVTEWAAFNVANGRWQTLKPLVLLSRSSGTTGSVDYTVAQGFQNHPLWAGLPASFTFPSATNVGAMIPAPGVARVAVSQLAGDAVVLRDVLNSGRVVDLSTAGNFAPNTWTDTHLQTLVVNACKWASASRVNLPPVATPGGPYNVNEGATVTLAGSCPDPDMDAQTLQWDFRHNGSFVAADAIGATPTFSAVNIQGPATVTIALKCTDSGGLSNVASATVNVANVAPSFTTMPPMTATEASLYTYQAAATDPGFGDVVTCSVQAGPMGMTVDNNCKVSWLPTFGQAVMGTASVDLRASDQNGAFTDQKWTIQVAWLNTCMNGMPDTWQFTYFGQGVCVSPSGDPDMDGRPNLKEFLDGTDPTKYDGPSAPTVMAPDGGVRTSLNPSLAVQNAIEPHGDPLTYEFQIYSDKSLINLVDVQIGVPQTQGSTTFTVQNALQEDHHYWWRARARDPYVNGAWSAVATFFADATHDAPTAPGISMPMVGAHVAVEMPTLAVTDAVSTDEYALTYTFELYSDGNLTQLVESQAMIAEVKGTTTHPVQTKLTDYATYYWRAKATDSLGLDGPWSPVANFEVTPGNPPPTDPKTLMPADGSTVTTHTPTVTVGGSIDPDEEKVSYQCDLDVKDTFDTPEKQSALSLMPGANDVATWMPSALSEDVHYCVRCRARDNSGASNWVQACFFVDAQNDPPSVPTLQNPSPGGMAAAGAVRFTWVDSVDPEADDVRYEVQLAQDMAFAKVVGTTTGEDGRVGVTIDGVVAGGYFWRARAVDVKGAASDWAKPNAFTTVEDPRLTPTTDLGGGGCSCAVGGRARLPLPSALLALALLALLLRRRSPGGR